MDKGTHSHCSDFQVHTPRDRHWHGDRSTTDEERHEYAQEFIAKCRELGIDAVAITDHHDIAFVDYIRAAAANEKDGTGNLLPPENRIVVFPGIELTLGIPCQALLIFDSNLPRDAINLALTRLGITPAPDSEPICGEHARLEEINEFSQLHELLDVLLKGRYIVIPNVSDGGSDTLLRRGLSVHYKKMPCVGGYIDGSIDDVGTGNRNIIDGRSAEYGYKAVGVFQTSDNRWRDFRDLGRATTYVKWAEPTAEALRQACLARESRLFQTKPVIPAVTLTSLNVSNSSFMGPFFVEFNRQFNAIIGGRGTGKSTVLEYIRWVLCDEPPTFFEEEELPSYQVRRAKLISQTLTNFNANVEVNFIVNQVPHIVRRDAATSELTLKIGDGEFEPCSETDIRNLLPIQAYSQKQLSSVAVRIEELLRFIHIPIRKELDAIDYRLDELATEIRSIYDSLQQKRLIQRAIENDERAFKSLSEQVTAIRRDLKGLSKEEQEILSKYTGYEKEEEIITGWLEDIRRTYEAFVSLSELIDKAPKARSNLEDLLNAPILKRMENEVITLFEHITHVVTEASERLRCFEIEDSPFSIVKKEWEGKNEEFQKSYVEAKEKSSAHEVTLKQLGDLEVQLKKLRARLMSKRAGLKDVGSFEQQFADLRNQWCSLHEERSNLIGEQCKTLTQISSSQIRATLEKGALISEVAIKLRISLTGSKVRGDKIDNLCSIIAGAKKPIYKFKEILDELELLALYDPDEPGAQLPATPILSNADFTASELLRMAKILTPEAWLELCLLQLGDKPVFEYQRKEREYIAFEDASVGQQATSLLWALLNQPGSPLIIDQPEEDLDNRMILKIVQQIWKAKQQRQLIFSSHNANIVVNGDAELVICCDYRVAGQQSGGHIKYEGAIDVENVRNEITRVTEGGPEAFKLRKEKYGF